MTTPPDDEPFVGRESFCAAAEGVIDYCSPEDVCAPGAACVTGGCNPNASVGMPTATHCVPAGAACASVDDCCDNPPCAGVNCTDGVCQGEGGDCNGWRTCPEGFACEDGACTDRRAWCSTSAQCPVGYACYRAAVDTTATCHWIAGAECTEDDDCAIPPLYKCATEGNAKGNCVFRNGKLPGITAKCTTDDDCQAPSGLECVSIPGAAGKRCVDPDAQGVFCADDNDCENNSETCVDTNGFGIKRCQPAGICTTDSDCAMPASLCFERNGSGVSRCG